MDFSYWNIKKDIFKFGMFGVMLFMAALPAQAADGSIEIYNNPPLQTSAEALAGAQFPLLRLKFSAVGQSKIEIRSLTYKFDETLKEKYYTPTFFTFPYSPYLYVSGGLTINPRGWKDISKDLDRRNNYTSAGAVLEIKDDQLFFDFKSYPIVIEAGKSGVLSLEASIPFNKPLPEGEMNSFFLEADGIQAVNAKGEPVSFINTFPIQGPSVMLGSAIQEPKDDGSINIDIQDLFHAPELEIKKYRAKKITPMPLTDSTAGVALQAFQQMNDAVYVPATGAQAYDYGNWSNGNPIDVTIKKYPSISQAEKKWSTGGISPMTVVFETQENNKKTYCYTSPYAHLFIVMCEIQYKNIYIRVQGGLNGGLESSVIDKEVHSFYDTHVKPIETKIYKIEGPKVSKKIPAHAHVFSNARGWKCNKGYRISKNKKKCLKRKVPIDS